MPNFKRSPGPAEKTKCDLLIVGCYEGFQLTPTAERIDKALKGSLKQHLKQTRSLGFAVRRQFKGRVREVAVVPSLGKLAATEVMVVGLGKKGDLSAESIRRAAGAAARNSGGYKHVALDLGSDLLEGVNAAIEGFSLGAYAYTDYLTKKPPRTTRVSVIDGDARELKRSTAVAEATEWARDLVNSPPSSRSPASFCEMAAARCSEAGIKTEIFDDKKLEKLGMEGILTVGRGSANPPRLMVMTYEPAEPTETLGLIGKGITFDSGGLSLKPAEAMETMKMDCSGAAAVVAAMSALPAIGATSKVIGAVAVAENMPGGRAVKPGDVIRHYGGITSEVLNTDAEGRLVLADTLAWMAEQRPAAMVDLATLTGGMMIALGTKVAGFFATDPDLGTQLLFSSARTGEALWPMPLIDDYREDLDSAVADIKNITGSRYASPIIGGLFLKDFVGNTPWAHLDIAGPAWSYVGEHYLPIGATGFGTRLLIDWIENRQAI